MDMTLPNLMPDLGYYSLENSEDCIGYRELARYIIFDAIRDIKKWNRYRPMHGPRFVKAQDAMRFLFGNQHRHIRALWLSWLDLEDTLLQTIAEQEGFKNMITEVCGE